MSEAHPLFFDGWAPLLRTLIVGTLSYVALLALLRVSGARTISRMTPFDFAISVAMGATFGRLMTAEDVVLAEALVTFLLLIGFQLFLSIFAIRSTRVARLLTPQPALLFYRGEFLHRNMRRERISEAELRGAVRQHGFGAIEDVEAIAVESGGTISVVGRADRGRGSVLRELEP